MITPLSRLLDVIESNKGTAVYKNADCVVVGDLDDWRLYIEALQRENDDLRDFMRGVAGQLVKRAAT